MQNVREEPPLVFDTGRDEDYVLRQTGSQFVRVQPVPQAQRRLQMGMLRVSGESGER